MKNADILCRRFFGFYAVRKTARTLENLANLSTLSIVACSITFDDEYAIDDAF